MGDNLQAASDEDAAPLISLSGVHVAFGGAVALHDESFAVRPGEIVGLLGHNGAGKSTLVNVATGALRPQRGTMSVDGRSVPLRGEPREVEAAGVKVIHQEPALADNLTVADNIALGRAEDSLPRTGRRRFAREALALLGSTIDVDRPVGSLAFGQKQVVDLARALSTKLRVLFLDEPTGALGQAEADRLHALLRQLAADGRAIVYVSHRLRDILSVCSRIVVLRGGRVVLDRPASAFTLADLSQALAPTLGSAGHRRSNGSTSATAIDISWRGHEISFAKGCITGLFGMAAGPQFALCESLFGLDGPIDARLDGENYAPASPRDAIRRGVFYVSANREKDGLLVEMSAVDNLVMPWLSRHGRYGFVSRSSTRAAYEVVRSALNVRGGHPDAPIGALSGGNRQKIILGRWMFGSPPVALLLAQPTQGVDVGAREDIARGLRELADRGVTVIVASSESDEIELLCDVALVCEGPSWPRCEPGPEWSERMLEALVAQARH